MLPRRPTQAEQELKARMRRLCEEDRAVLMAWQPFTARLLLQLELVVVADDRVPTAATDGRHVFLNARFLEQRSDEDRRFILAHEVWHCALIHLHRRQQRDAALWNQACDHEVNLLLSQALGHCPDDALCNEDFTGLSAEVIHKRLQQRPELQMPGQFDVHDPWAALGAPASVIDPDFAPVGDTGSPATARRWRQKLLAVAQQTERGHDQLPGEMRRLVQSLRQQRLPWRTLLAQFISQVPGGDRQWLPPSRRMLHAGLYLPRRCGQQISLTVAIDCSGSCMDAAPRFLAELQSLLTAFDRVQLRLLGFDTRVELDQQLTEQDLHQLQTPELLGWGGTDLCAPFDHLAESGTDLLVILTDGLGPAPKSPPSYPVLWILTEGGESPAEWAQIAWLD